MGLLRCARISGIRRAKIYGTDRSFVQVEAPKVTVTQLVLPFEDTGEDGNQDAFATTPENQRKP